MALASINGSNGYIWSIPSDITVAYKSGNINYQIYFTNPDACYYTVDLLIDGQTVYEQPAQRGNSSVAGYWTCEASDYASTALDMMVGYTSRPFSIILRSYSDSDYSIYLGSVTRTGNVTVSATCRPLFTTFTLANENKSIANTDKYSNVLVTSSTSTLLGSDAGNCIAGISKIKAFIADANQMIPKYSATGDYYRLTINGVSADADFVDGDVSIYLDNADPEVSASVSGYDSRGLSTTVTLPFTHIADYSSVSAYNLVAHRTDEIETETTLSFSGSYFNEYFGGGTTGILNTITAHWRYKPTTDAWGAQTWNAITVTDTNGSLSFEDTIAGDLGATGFDADKSFSIEIRLFDKLTNIILETTLPKGKPVLHLTKEGVSVMAKYDATLGGALQVTGDTNVTGDVAIVGEAYKNGTMLGVPVGSIIQTALRVAPNGYLFCHGQSVSRTTYADLFNAIVPSLGTATMSIANPCVVTLSGHGLLTGDRIYFTTTGALPTGLAVNTLYWVIYINANTFNLTTSFAYANAGTNKIATSGTQSGVHTIRFAPFGLGDGSTTFSLPNFDGRIPVGHQSAVAEFDSVGMMGGEAYHALTVSELPSHNHSVVTIPNGTGWAAPNWGLIYSYSASATYTGYTGNTGSNVSHNNLQPYIITEYLIKY